MSVNVLDIEVCIGDNVYTWNGKASFYIFKNSDRKKSAIVQAVLLGQI